MTVAFRANEVDDLGLAAYLRVVRSEDERQYDGVLFLVNGAGEPVEFCFSGLEAPRTVLWGKAALRRRVNAELTKALLGACASTPVVILARAEEIGPETLAEDAIPEIPSCRVTRRLDAVAVGVRDQEEPLDDNGEIQLVWTGEAPADDSAARRLMQRIADSGLLMEPFERALAGLAEVRRGE